MIHRRMALGAFVALSACATPAPENVAVAAASITGCRSVCFAFARMSCDDVERQCGRNARLLVIDGDPFPCTEAEPVACHFGTLDPLTTCLDECGGADYGFDSKDGAPSTNGSFDGSGSDGSFPGNEYDGNYDGSGSDGSSGDGSSGGGDADFLYRAPMRGDRG